jgi:hypothetical protein
MSPQSQSHLPPYDPSPLIKPGVNPVILGWMLLLGIPLLLLFLIFEKQQVIQTREAAAMPPKAQPVVSQVVQPAVHPQAKQVAKAIQAKPQSSTLALNAKASLKKPVSVAKKGGHQVKVSTQRIAHKVAHRVAHPVQPVAAKRSTSPSSVAAQ